MEKIFVIEDDENIRELVQIALEGYGYEVEAFETAEKGLKQMEEAAPDLAVFDLMLPGMDGLTAIRRLRERKPIRNMPVIILTAKDKEYDKVIAQTHFLADQIITVTAPEEPRALPAYLLAGEAVRSLLRRCRESGAEEDSGSWQLGKLTIDGALRRVFWESREILLTYKEYELLTYLIANRKRVVPREELLDRLWDYTADVETRTLDIHIRTLRQKLGDEGGGHIRTIRSVGYRFAEDGDR